MEEKIPELERETMPSGVDENDLEKYGRNLEEFEELKKIEEEYEKTSRDLDFAKNKLSLIEEQMRRSREEERRRERAAEECFERGVREEEKGGLKTALECFLEAIEHRPRHLRAIRRVQELKRRLREREIEKERREHENRERDRKAAGHFDTAKKYYRGNRYEKALEEFILALEAGGRNPEIPEWKERCEQRIREVEESMNRAAREAREKERRVRELSLHADSHFRKEEFEEGIALLEEALLLVPDNRDVQDRLRRAEERAGEKREHERARAEERAKRLSQIGALRLKADDLLRQNKMGEALRELEAVLSLDPENDEVRETIRRIREEIAALRREKKRNLEQTERRKREKEEALREHYGRGIGFFSMNDLERSAEAFTRVMMMEPRYRDVEEYLRRIGERSAERERREREERSLDRKEERAFRAREQAGRDARREESRKIRRAAEREISEGRLGKAVKLLEHCLVLDEENEIVRNELEELRLQASEEKRRRERIDFLNERAECFFSNGFFQESESAWKEVLEVDPNDSTARRGLGRCVEAFQRENEQKRREEEERRAFEEHVRKRRLEAAALMSARRFREAVAAWNAVLELDPCHPEASRLRDATLEMIRLETLGSEALVETRRAMEAERLRIETLYDEWNRAESELRQGEFDTALKRLDKIKRRLETRGIDS